MINIGPVLSSGNPMFQDIHIIREVDPREVQTICVCDPTGVQKQIDTLKQSDVTDVLQKYDLRDIDGTEMTAFVQLLREKRAVDEETEGSLSGHTLSVFEGKAVGARVDFISEIEKLQKIITEDPQADERCVKIINRVVAEVHSIEQARKNGASAISIDTFA